MIKRQTLWLVQRQEHLHQEHLVLLFQRQCESVDDGAKNLQKLSDAVERVGFVDESARKLI